MKRIAGWIAGPLSGALVMTAPGLGAYQAWAHIKTGAAEAVSRPVPVPGYSGRGMNPGGASVLTQGLGSIQFSALDNRSISWSNAASLRGAGMRRRHAGSGRTMPQSSRNGVSPALPAEAGRLSSAGSAIARSFLAARDHVSHAAEEARAVVSAQSVEGRVSSWRRFFDSAGVAVGRGGEVSAGIESGLSRGRYAQSGSPLRPYGYFFASGDSSSEFNPVPSAASGASGSKSPGANKSERKVLGLAAALLFLGAGAWLAMITGTAWNGVGAILGAVGGATYGAWLSDRLASGKYWGGYSFLILWGAVGAALGSVGGALLAAIF